MRILIVSFFVLLVSLVILVADLSTLPAHARQSINPALGPELSDKRAAASLCFPGADTGAHPAAGVRVRVFIDGSDVMKVQENRVWIEHRNYTLPGLWDSNNFPVHIDNNRWMPSWKNNPVSDRFVLRGASLPMAPTEVRVAPLQARGILKVTEYPSKENNYTLGLLLDDDVLGGAVWYDIAIAWREAPEGTVVIGSPSPEGLADRFAWSAEAKGQQHD